MSHGEQGGFLEKVIWNEEEFTMRSGGECSVQKPRGAWGVAPRAVYMDGGEGGKVKSPAQAGLYNPYAGGREEG